MKLRYVFSALLLALAPVTAQAAEQNALEFLKDIRVDGFLDTYYSYNSNRPENRSSWTGTGDGGETSRFRAFDREDNSITVDNFELVLRKVPDEKSRAGFTLITNYGEIAKRIVFSKHPNYGRRDDDDFTISTAYVNYLADVGSGLNIKVGRFPTWIGTEVWESIGNPNWSRSYLYQNAIPFTHTGVAAEYNLTDNLTLGGYLVNGWDSFEDNNNEKSPGARISYHTDKFSFTVNGIHGNEKNDVNDGDPALHNARSLLDLILDVNPTDKLHLNLNADFGSEKKTGRWQGYAGIVDYDFTDTFNLALRGEYFHEDCMQDANSVFMSRTGIQQDALDLYEVTLTGNFKVSEKIMVRPEYRRDWSNDRVFDANRKYSQETYSISVAYIF